MKKKKIIIIIACIGVVIFGIIAFFLFQKNGIKANQDKLTNDIIDRIDKKEDLLIFITDNDEKCYLCGSINTTLKFYEEEYNLKFITYNKTQNTEANLKKIKQKLKIEKEVVKEPAVLIVKNGESKYIVNEMFNEIILRQFLIEGKLISDETKTDQQLTLDEFKTKLSSPEKSMVVILDYGEESLKARKTLLNLSKKYNFEYTITYYGVSDGALITLALRNKEKDNQLITPYIAIIQNDEIVDSISGNDEKKILNFLTKNNMVKE